MKARKSDKARLALKLTLVLLLPTIVVSIVPGTASSKPSGLGSDGGVILAQTEEAEEVARKLPSAFTGTAQSAAIVPYVAVPLEGNPALPYARAVSSFPESALGLGYVSDPGLVASGSVGGQGLRVPTEVTCSVPGGRPKEEFNSGERQEANGQIRIGGGTARTVCALGPTTTTSGYLYNLMLLSTSSSQGAEPPGQISVLTVGLASVISRSTLSSNGLLSESVAELKDLNIGANGQAHFDFLRVESLAFMGMNREPRFDAKITYGGFKTSTGTSQELNAQGLEAANALLKPSGIELEIGRINKGVSEDQGESFAKAIGLKIEGMARGSSPSDQIWGERKLSVALGFADAKSNLIPDLASGTGESFGDTGGGLGVTLTNGETEISEVTSYDSAGPAAEPPALPSQLAGGKFALSLDWSSFKVRPLSGKQAAAVWGGIAWIVGAVTLLRRRLSLLAG